MTETTVEHRVAFDVEVPGTPEQVWTAIATAGGISSWFLPTDVEERLGGAYVTHMGETDAPGTVTGWDPPRRFAIEEPEWAAMAGHPEAVTAPMATEFLVEAQSGGTCVVRVVSSAYGTGADWEAEFITDMERHWRPYFDRLRLYLAHFPGQVATTMVAEARVPGEVPAVFAAMCHDLGVGAVGSAVEAHGLVGTVEIVGDGNAYVRVTSPVQGFLGLAAFGPPDSTTAAAGAQLFSDNAATWVEQNQSQWQSWLEGLAVPTA